jgi:alanyl-tRNA synthetase
MIVVNQTPFYAESGGQVGDTGEITGDNGLRAVVTDTSKQIGRLHVHHARLESGEVAVGDPVRLRIDTARRAGIRANHSATHLLHAALRERLGNHVAQKGSLVAPDRLRFDVSHPSAMGPAELAQVEDDVNAQVRANTPVATRLMTPEDAIAEGAMALFGEKYGDEVRVVSMGTDGGRYSVELCGGTHVSALGDIGLFKVVGESAVSSGIRRVEALTGDAARAYLNGRDEKLRATAAVLKSSPDEVPARVAALLEERRRLERELADAKRALAMGGGKAAEAQGPEQIGGHGFIGQVIEGLDPKSLRGLVDDAKKRVGSGVVALVAVNDGRATVAVGVTDDLTDGRNAVDLVRKAVAELGGQGGGGRPDMAQGGGPDASKAEACPRSRSLSAPRATYRCLSTSRRRRRSSRGSSWSFPSSMISLRSSARFSWIEAITGPIAIPRSTSTASRAGARIRASPAPRRWPLPGKAPRHAAHRAHGRRSSGPGTSRAPSS